VDGFVLISSVRQHRHHAIVVCLRDEHIDIEMALSLIGFLRQYVARMRMAALDFPGGRQPHTFGCAFVGFKFWHD
jgi:hypothetical protein